MKTKKKEIVLTKPWTGEEEYASLRSVISSGWLSQGEQVAAFEAAVCRYTGARFAVATTSCTTALHLSLVIAGIKAGDEVICPAFSFIASANVIEYVGGRPVFVDIDEETFNLDPQEIERHISAKTRAIVAVHQIGLACDLDKINRIAKKRNLTVIEDAACALGASYKGRKIGARSAYCCLSFHPRKVITTGEGGMLLTNSRSIARQAASLRSHGASVSAVEKHRSKGLRRETFTELGYNYRMTDLQAAIGVVQMKKLRTMILTRQKIAQNYARLLADIPGIITPFVPADSGHTFQSYLLKINPYLGIKIETLLRFMAECGVSCRRGIQPIHLEPYYRGKYGRVSLPVTEEIADSTLFLPIYHTLSLSEQKYIVDTLKKGLVYAGKKNR
ncbi:MAG: DegT/DnrJ/EryC1/StrS family aminotransferase [Candidatus Omnitrophota bacterium]